MKKIFLLIILIFSLTGCGFFGETNDTIDIDNSSFTYDGYTKNISTSINLSTNTTTYKYNININATTTYEIYYISMEAKIYNGTTLLTTATEEKNSIFKANSSLTLSTEVSSSIYSSVTKVEATFTGKANSSENSSSFTVTFVYNNDKTSNSTKTVSKNKTVSKPTNPTKTNFLFDKWCTDYSLTTEYDFSSSVTKNLTLYAAYTVDYATITNTITTKTMRSVVTLITKSYDTFLGITTNSVYSSGSGVIFYESSNYYYFLSNSHVSVKYADYDKVSYEVEDYIGNSYTGYLYHEDPSYDLSVLYFKKSTTLEVISLLETDNTSTNDVVIALGQPKGQTNALTYGIANSYVTAPTLSTESYRSNVKFNVLKHSAEIDNGSSGGPLLDANLNLIGINYAGATYSNGSFAYAYAIPIEKVHEFLNKYIWS